MPMFKRGCVVLLLIVASACGGNSSTAPTPTPTPTISSIGLSANLTALNKKGATTQTIATATFSNGTTQDVTGTCANWQSDNQSVVTVNGSGLLTAQSSGSATITTTCQGVTGRGLATLNLVTKATPTLTASVVVSISPEPLFLFRAKFTYTFAETGGVYGINVNFLNTQITQGGVTSALTNYNPGAFSSIWGTNHIGAGKSNSVVETVDYNGGFISHISTFFTGSVGDDLGNEFALSNTISGSLSVGPGVVLPTLAGRDPLAFRVVR